MPAAQRTAWDAYLTVTRGLLPAVDDPIRAATAGSMLDGFAARIEQYAPLWGEHGPMMVAALHGVLALQWGGDRAGLAGLLRAMADRLYLISTGPRPARGGGHERRRCQRNVGVYRPRGRAGPPHRRGGCHG
ncbi:hypothetical protein KZZ52_31885 [Dactylosporangium sp. AC04546]|uniref:hypothetical protein n=1 Tax=Dactylosporangium sp. AC04546 TaxID=2862460 RepID=UPI001EDCCD3E|nr:hypothetical protein [Dactylosporangium sp. AC04546]WVK78593.1 hypothetical protein KZZ52_31885 [Dactylosporangium sp. AC04546]